MKSCIVGITSESYPWDVASNSVAAVDVADDGESIVLVQTDHTDSFGTAASLSHIRNFHVDRLANLIRQVNDALGLNNDFERRELKQHRDLWDRCQGLFKGDIHIHLKAYIGDDEALQVALIGMTYHVAESIADVSMESGIRHLFEALYMKPFPEVDERDVPLLNRVGHAIVIALPDYDQLRGKSVTEDVEERIRQIEFDLKLCRIGIPLLAVSEEALQVELKALTTYVALRKRLASGEPPDKASSLMAIAERWGIGPEGRMTYT